MAKKKIKPNPKKAVRREKTKSTTKRSNRKTRSKKNLEKTQRKSVRDNARAKKSKTRKTKTNEKRRGYSTSISVFSRKLNKSLTIIRKETILKKSEEVSVRKGYSKKAEVLQVLLPLVLKHYETIGKSYKNSFIFRIKYRYKRQAKVNLIKEISYYGTPVTEMKNKKEATFYFDDLVENFLLEVRNYIEKGFQELVVIGVNVQGYKL